jgi:hypothetical protein
MPFKELHSPLRAAESACSGLGDPGAAPRLALPFRGRGLTRRLKGVSRGAEETKDWGLSPCLISGVGAIE